MCYGAHKAWRQNACIAAEINQSNKEYRDKIKGMSTRAPEIAVHTLTRRGTAEA